MKALNKDIIREIIRSKSRFLTLIIIVFLCSLTYVGLNSTVYDIKKSINNSVIKNNMYDIRVEVPIGFTDSDIATLKSLNNIESIKFYNETVDYDKKILYIENDNLKENTALSLQNMDNNYILPGYKVIGKGMDISYPQDKIIKSGVTMEKAFLIPKTNKIKNVAIIKLKNSEKYDTFSDKYINYIKEYKEKLNLLLAKRPSEREQEIHKNLSEGLEKIDNGFIEINRNNEKLAQNKKKILVGLDKINEKKEEFLSFKSKIEKNKKLLEENLKKLQSEKAKLEQVQGMDDEKNALNSKYEQVQKEYKSLIINEKAYKTSYEKALKNFENEKAKLQNSNKKLKEADREINIKRQELETKKNELNNQKKFVIKPMYSVGSRYDNDAFLTLYNNIKSTKIMCYLFPACFFIIGLFVTSTTMIRFSTEQRINVGIYKFLGYDSKHIVIKFLIYGLVPTIIGLLIGSIAGTYLLPRFIIPTLLVGFNIFKDIKLYFVPTYAIVIVSSFIITSIITILIVVYIQLNDKTINLLTGKTTTVVKRVIFEKTILWKKLSFSKKILFRNLFKYKGRMLMTILGIGSCTALIYFGISLHFAFSDITKYQYTKIKKYDAIVYFNYNVSKEKKEEYINKISNFADLYLVNTNEKKFKHKGLDYKIIHEYLIKGSDKQFFNFNLKEHESEISLKTSEILKKKKGDYIDLSDIYNEVERIKIDGVFQNYIAQYVYTKDSSKESNAVIVKFKNNNIDINKLLDKDVVFNIRTKHDTKEFFIKQINSLSIVIVLMIILGAMLATIVTYNLGNINIIERKRELSTLKVLGYTKLEMNLYIFREIIILALFSILIGLYLGRKLQLFFATQFVNSPIQLVMRLNYIPFVISFVLSLLIVIIVSIFLIFKINKINMVDALKVGD